MENNCTVEVYSRVTGFFRPVQAWNGGKEDEFHSRKHFDNSLEDKKEAKRVETAMVT